MARGLLLAIALAVACVGCKKAEGPVVYTPPTVERHGPEPTDPEAALYEQHRSGSVQLEAAAQTVAEVREQVIRMRNNVEGDAAAALDDILEIVDSVGATLTDVGASPPTMDDVKRDFAGVDDRRKRAIEAANDAYFELSEAQGASKSLEDTYPDFIKLSDLLNIALGDVAEAVAAYGGQVEKPKG